jgi:undecaprenyl-diphosphatase
MIDQLLQYDTDLFLFLNNLGSESWDGLWQFISEKTSWVPLYALFLYFIYQKLGWKGTLVVAITVALMITATDQLSNLFKHGFERPRPCRLEDLKVMMRFVAERCGRYGYFSAHAASSMAAAIFIGLLLKYRFKYLPFLLLFWAVVVAYSRIYLGVHYPLDIITGMLFGSIIGWGAYKLHLVGLRKFHI